MHQVGVILCNTKLYVTLVKDVIKVPLNKSRGSNHKECPLYIRDFNAGQERRLE